MADESSSNTAAMPWEPFATAWTRASGHMAKSVLEANRAMAAAFGIPGFNGDGESPAFEVPLTPMTYRRADWSFERSVDHREDLAVGDYVRFTKQLADDDVHAFAKASGDTNRLHLDDEFAVETRFKQRIAHGTLVSGTISAALARLPGLTIYLSQDLEFLRPVDIGDEVTATCKIVEDLGDDKYRLTTVVENTDGETVVDGEAVVLIDELPDVDE
ncbi:MAG: MaoC family dehydratase [Halobacteriales archaeon]